MLRIHSSDRGTRGGVLLKVVPLAALLLANGALAQDVPAPPAPPGTRIVSHEVSVSRSAATLKLELSDGRDVELALANGQAMAGGQLLGAAARGGELDRSWRELLNAAIDADSNELPRLLDDWSAEGDVGTALDRALEQAVAGTYDPTAPLEPAPISDSVSKLVERIAELEQQQAELAEVRERTERRFERDAPRRWQRGPLDHFLGGVGELFSLLVMYVILFAIGVATIVFGGRKYIEGVADTARNATMRSFLVGLAGAFLTVPAWVLGMIALVVSIIGIPAVLLFAPGFILAAGLAVLLGYLAVAHAAGEALGERRYYGAEWFQRSNSYYFLMTGIGMLLALFIASAVVSMAGAWLGFISGLLKFFAVSITVIVMLTGYGAVLLSRGGTRPIRADGVAAESDLFTDAEGTGL